MPEEATDTKPAMNTIMRDKLREFRLQLMEELEGLTFDEIVISRAEAPCGHNPARKEYAVRASMLFTTYDGEKVSFNLGGTDNGHASNLLGALKILSGKQKAYYASRSLHRYIDESPDAARELMKMIEERLEAKSKLGDKSEEEGAA